jgi:hypothetical protein
VFFRQITAESLQDIRFRGRVTGREWVKNGPNHYLDCYVGNTRSANISACHRPRKSNGPRSPRGTAVTVIDIRAGLLSPTLKTLSEIGFIDSSKCTIVVLHVLGNSQASIGEVKAITGSIASSRYVAVGNHINDSRFDFPADALDIPMLNARACENVDAAGVSFFDYINSDASAVLRGKVKHWLGLVFAQFDAAQVNAQ